MFRFRGTCSVRAQYRTNEGLPQARTSDRPKPGKGCKGEVLSGGCTGDEVEQLVDLASIGWKSPLDRRLRTRMATRPIQFTGMEERNTPKSELLPKDRRPILISQCECRI